MTEQEIKVFVDWMKSHGARFCTYAPLLPWDEPTWDTIDKDVLEGAIKQFLAEKQKVDTESK